MVAILYDSKLAAAVNLEVALQHAVYFACGSFQEKNRILKSLPSYELLALSNNMKEAKCLVAGAVLLYRANVAL